MIIDLLTEALSKLPSKIRRKYFRADKAFFDKNVIDFLVVRKIKFAIVARLTKPIKKKIAGLKYHSISSHFATAEFLYQPHGWPNRFRFIVIRRQIIEEPSKQLTLFKLGKYHYQVIVTNLHLKPVNIWHFYNRRATAELVIRELKEGYATGKIPTKYFEANSAFFQIILLAYNLLNWFKRLTLPEDYKKMTIESLRHRLLVVPAELVYPKGKPTLKLSQHHPDKKAFQETITNIEKLKKSKRMAGWQ